MTKLTTSTLLTALITALAACTASLEAPVGDDTRSDDATLGLRFHGFDPALVESEQAREGLEAVFAGQGFRNGFL